MPDVVNGERVVVPVRTLDIVHPSLEDVLLLLVRPLGHALREKVEHGDRDNLIAEGERGVARGRSNPGPTSRSPSRRGEVWRRENRVTRATRGTCRGEERRPAPPPRRRPERPRDQPGGRPP